MTAQYEIITSKNLVAGYPSNIVWRDANLSVNRGEFVAVIGPNGAGKTTMFRLLLGLQQPISGSIRVFGEPPRRGNPKIGYVPQRHSIGNDTNIECAELVRLAYSGHQWGLNLSPNKEREIALATLDAVGATDLAH